MYVGTRLQLTTYDDVIYRYLRSLESDDGGALCATAARAAAAPTGQLSVIFCRKPPFGRGA